jgi:catechol 2,3-dioxygenase-like lactoylglutathione lyase family enzyme
MPTMKTAMGQPLDMKLEVVLIGVTDVDRAKEFYQKLGWRLDADFVKGDDFRAIQFTPHNSPTSIIFGKGIPAPKPGALQSLTLAVDDIIAVRDDLVARGVDISEVFQFGGGPFDNTEKSTRVSGRDPEGRSYYSFASFEDPDGNGYLLQEIQTRLPGREWDSARSGNLDTGKLAELLHETEQHHGDYEKAHGKHNWWDWYAPYLGARLNGRTAEEAVAAADRSMDAR